MKTVKINKRTVITKHCNIGTGINASKHFASNDLDEFTTESPEEFQLM